MYDIPMNYILLAAALLTPVPESTPSSPSLPPPKTPEQQVLYVDQVLAWCKRVESFHSGDADIYSRTIVINRGRYTITYEDRGRAGKTVEDILTIEGRGILFIDKSADGQTESGELEGIFFLKDRPPGQLKRGQEIYSALLERIAKNEAKETDQDDQEDQEDQAE